MFKNSAPSGLLGPTFLGLARPPVHLPMAQLPFVNALPSTQVAPGNTPHEVAEATSNLCFLGLELSRARM